MILFAKCFGLVVLVLVPVAVVVVQALNISGLIFATDKSNADESNQSDDDDDT